MDPKSAEVEDVFERHAGFLAAASKCRMRNLVFPLQELAYNDPHLSYH